MKKILVALCVTCALALAVHADEKKDKATPEQKAERKALLEKYDANKDGKLDKEEKSKISAEDKEKLKKAHGERKKKKSE